MCYQDLNNIIQRRAYNDAGVAIFHLPTSGTTCKSVAFSLSEKPAPPRKLYQEKPMNSPFLFVDEVDVYGKTVLLRLDLNVPVRDNVVTDATRIERVLPGLRALLEAGAAVVILTHFGRPKGKVVPEYSVAPVVAALAQRLGRDVPVAADLTGEAGRQAAKALGSGDVLMMENLRFHPGEEANDANFAASLAALGDIYVGDAFSCAHRAHASVEALPRQMDIVCAGRSMGAELAALDAALSQPKRPVVAVVGGAKVSTKLQILENLVTRVDGIILGGGMANTFLMAEGHAIGTSLVEADMLGMAADIVAAAKTNDCRLILPVDAMVAREFKANAPHRIVPVNKVAEDEMILDVGPESIAMVNDFIKGCETIVWNGPMGAFEIPPFDSGTNAVAAAVAAQTKAGKLLSVAGGGDTMAALANAGVSDQFSYVSTAGGAFLEWLEGKILPGVEALRRNG